jgi:hypothetical protein
VDFTTLYPVYELASNVPDVPQEEAAAGAMIDVVGQGGFCRGR